jgi:hypothetical protein
MNAIKSLAVDSLNYVVKTFKEWECDGYVCESVGMAALGIATMAVMFTALAQLG